MDKIRNYVGGLSDVSIGYAYRILMLRLCIIRIQLETFHRMIFLLPFRSSLCEICFISNYIVSLCGYFLWAVCVLPFNMLFLCNIIMIINNGWRLIYLRLDAHSFRF